MNILHVLSGDFVSGAETSTAAVIEQQIQHGHRVWVAAGSFTQPTKAQVAVLPVYKRDFLRRILNVLSLMRLIRRENIDIVHAHSRASSWVCYWASRLTRTPYLSTLHGRQHLHFTSRHFNVYGSACVTVCEDIRDQMLGETKIFKPEQLLVVRNGLNL